jgi:hypothetical protein
MKTSNPVVSIFLFLTGTIMQQSKICAYQVILNIPELTPEHI